MNDGQLCVRGRFCLPEATHHYSRARQPMLRKGAYFRVASWDEALDEVAARLAGRRPRRGADARLRRPRQRGAVRRPALRARRPGRRRASTRRPATCLPGGPLFWSRLFALPISLEALAEAETVIVAGLDTRFSFSVAGVQVRRAMRRGARLVVVDARESNLARLADDWLRARRARRRER